MNNYKTIKNGRKNSKFYEFADGTQAVSSYDTLVGIYHDGVLYELGHSSYSPTTARHYTDFLLKYDIHRHKTPTVVNCPPAITWHGEPSYGIGRYNNLVNDLCNIAHGSIIYPQLVSPKEAHDTKKKVA